MTILKSQPIILEGNQFIWNYKSEGNPEEKPCQPKANLILPKSFTWIYILFVFIVINRAIVARVVLQNNINKKKLG